MSKFNFLLIIFLISGCFIYKGNAQESVKLKSERKDKSLKILLISDLNDAYGSTTYSKEVKWAISKIDSIKPDLILCGGDMVAGQKASLSADEVKAMWNGFNETVFKPIVEKKIPFGFTIGNHDASPNFKIDRLEATAFWSSNKENANLTFVDDTHFPYYFSYIKNNVFFVSWDASSSEIKPEILNWLKVQMRTKTAKRARLRILLGHLPLFALVDAKNKTGEVLSQSNEKLIFLKENGIDIYVSGHQHVYYPGQVDNFKLLHLGCLGGGPRKLIGINEPAKKAYAILNIPTKKGSSFDLMGYEPIIENKIILEKLPKEINGFNGKVDRLEIK